MMKVYAVIYQYSIYVDIIEKDVDVNEIVSMFSNEKSANSFHEKLLDSQGHDGRSLIYYVKEYDVIGD